jgi:endonuclease-8
MAALGHLGPDLIDPDTDLAAVVRRARHGTGDRSISEVLLDQRVAAGIGNVYRNEVLFEAGTHPERPLAQLSDEQVRWLFERAAAQLRANVGRHRTTTGARRPGSETYVYDRAGRPCWRCGTTVESSRTTDRQRTTYWCPSCQPAPGSSSSAKRASSSSSTGGRGGSGNETI